MQHVRSGQRSTRARATRREPPPVAVRYCCPRCGGPHPAAECGLDASNYRPRKAAELRELRRTALEEFPHAVRGGAGRAHLEQLARLVAAVDARLERLDA